MQDLQKAAPHLFMATVVIAAATVLALQHIIGGDAAAGMIIGVGGFTVGGTVASGSISTAAAATVATSPPVLSAESPVTLQLVPTQPPTSPTSATPSSATEGTTTANGTVNPSSGQTTPNGGA